MAIINFNSISGINTISVASSITVGNNVSIGTDRITATTFSGNLNSTSGSTTVAQLNVGTGGTVITTTAGGNVSIDSGTFYVDSTNNSVGINTTTQSSNCALMVVGNHVSGHSAIKIQRTDSNISSLGFYSQSEARDGIIYTNNGGVLVFESPQSIVMSPNNGVTAGTFGSTGLSFPSGKGIDFSATSDSSGTMSSELLDDYEEGTFTPTVQFGGGTTGIIYSERAGQYTKVGNLVWINMTVTLTNKGSSTGQATITGLPFISMSTNSDMRASGVLGYYGNMSSISGQITTYLGPTATTMEIFGSGSTASVVLTNSNFANNSSFRGSIIYITNT